MRGGQHYCRLFKDWLCVAAPVKELGGKVLGYLDISMHAKNELDLAVTILKMLLNFIKKEFLFSEIIKAKSINSTRKLFSTQDINNMQLDFLSPREKEILLCLLLNKNNKEIAVKLFLSTQTVKTYRKHIYHKLGVKSLPELLNKFNL